MSEGWRFPEGESWDVDPDQPDHKYKEPAKTKIDRKQVKTYLRLSILAVMVFIISYYGTMVALHR